MQSSWKTALITVVLSCKGHCIITIIILLWSFLKIIKFSFFDSASRWNLSSSYNIHLDVRNKERNYCHGSSIVDRALFFYPELSEDFFSLINNASNRPYSVNSRQLVTNFLDPSNVEWSYLDQGTENVLTCEPPDLTTTITEVTRTTTLPEVTGGMTEITDVVQSTVPETTATIITTEVSPTTVLEGIIRLAVVGSLSSQMQAQIMVCTSIP